MPFQLRRTGVRHPTLDEVTALRDEYAARHCVTLRDFLEPQLLSWLQRRVARGRWIETVHQALDPPSVDLMLVDDVASGAFVAMTNTPEVFDLVRSITGCAPIGCYAFRVYRMEQGKGRDSWHGDDDGNRLATLSVNIGATPFQGGGLELRERPTRRLVHRVHNTGPGDAILFRIAHDLEHCVEDVTGDVPKIALAGWFQKEPRGKISGHFL